MRLAIGIATLTAIVGIALWSMHQGLSDQDKAKNVLQLSSALLNLCLLGVAGGAVSYVYRKLEFHRQEQVKERDRLLEENAKERDRLLADQAKERDRHLAEQAKIRDQQEKDQRALRSYREAFLKEFLRSYHAAKAARRQLNRYGLTLKAGETSPFDAKQVAAYEDQMLVIQESQLAFEEFVADVRNTPHAFSEHANILKALQKMEKYLREILLEFEKNWHTLSTTPEAFTVADLEKLKDFTGRFNQSDYRDTFIVAKDMVLRLVRRDLLPSNNGS